MERIKDFFTNKKTLLSLTALKYIFAVLTVFLGYVTIQNWFYLLVGLLEIAIIAGISNYLLKKNKFVGWLVNSLLLLIVNIQSLVLFYSGSHVTLVMVTNLDSLEALSGNMSLYIWGVLGLVLTTFLPLVYDFWYQLFPIILPEKKVNRRSEKGFLDKFLWERLKQRAISLLPLFLLVELLFTMLYGNAYSPIFATYRLGLQQRDRLAQIEAIKNQPNITNQFYRTRVSSARDTPKTLADNPNVVLIFVEGLSSHIIEDERSIMPNTLKYQKQSLNFTDYYNHTFATYRGLIGQLYSGYQLDNYDENTLVSLPDLFEKEGYQTSFINTEPNNSQFASYLGTLGFDEVIGSPGSEYEGASNTLSDKQAFEKLFEVMEDKSKDKEPFFTSIYTFGTHMSLDSTDEKYKDGKDHLLNRFYDFDVQFGAFMDKFLKSDLAKDTVIVFTTDHATYADADFSKSFPDYKRINSDLDAVPFFIYHDGISPEEIEAGGRNSLDLAPTILDYVGISHPNYFLGASLFFPIENNNSFDTIFHNGTTILSTKEAKIGPLSEADQEIFDYQVQQYFAAKTQYPLDLEE